ncbi:unnamed protein product, partial [Ectocarpus sp. 8 AP-2014]
RVGFVSAHFRWHSVGRLTIGLLERLCTGRGLQVFVIDASSGVEGSSGSGSGGAGSDALQTAREAIAELRLDVLVYGDVGMDAFTTGLAHGRLSPVQVAFWGHPGTTGLSTMDYFVTSDLFEGELGADLGNRRRLRSNDRGDSSADDDTRYVEHREEAGRNPDVVAERHDRQHAFSEQLVRLGGLGFIFDDPALTFGKQRHSENSPPSSCGGDGRAASSPEVMERREAAEANRPRLYVCAQSLMKMHPAFDAVLAGILAADPLAQIVLLRDSRQLLWHSRFRRRLRAAVDAAEKRVNFAAVSTGTAAAQNGTGPASSPIRGGLWGRVRFVSPLSGREFFRLQCRADVVLDPFPFGGGVTTLEALACGTPVVTAGALQSVHRLAEGLIAAAANTQCQGREKHHPKEHKGEYIAKAVAVAAPGALKRKVRRALRCGRNGLLHGGGGGGGGGGGDGEDGSDVAADWERFLTNAAA